MTLGDLDAGVYLLELHTEAGVATWVSAKAY